MVTGNDVRQTTVDGQQVKIAVKATWYLVGGDPWGHPIKKLIEDLRYYNLSTHTTLISFIKEATILYRFQIPTRYANSFPDIIPDVA